MKTHRTRVLLVDDSASVLESIGRMLYVNRAEWDIAFASGGEEALTIVQETPVDVVLTDLKMPGLDGEMLIHRIHELRPGTRCILLCGDREAPRAVALSRQGVAVLEKPCDGDEIRFAIEMASRSQSRGCDREE